MVGQDLMWDGRLFQSLGAATEKAWSPLVLRREWGDREESFC
uniref:Uncharacterized protein n=1 Tax=Anguilla anguilla TaxID=7936 RepID=A0A0E9RMQ5_ANGAN